MLFDPTIDFNTQTAQAQQARVYADLLRKQAMQSQMPQGQMVSGHFVAPHWSQYLSGIMDQINAGWQNQIANTAEQNLGQAQAQAAAEWRAGLPQAVEAQAAVPAQSATPFGSRDMPQQDATTGSPAVPYQPVPTAVRLKHTLAGMSNPLTAKEAVMWNQGMAEETKREDEQAARRENLIATLAARREDALRRSEDARLTREQQAELRREAMAAQQMIAEMVNGTRRDISQASIEKDLEVARMRAAEHAGAAATRKQEHLDKQLPMIAERNKEINPLISSGQSLQDLFDKYGGKPIPGFGYAGKLPGVALSTEGNANRATLKAFTNAIMRAHAGLSQTLAEQHNVNLETLADGNYSEKEIRKVWPLLREKANDALRGINAGFDPEVVSIYKQRGGLVSPIATRTADTAPAPRPQANVVPPQKDATTPADAKAEQIRIIQSEYNKATNPQDVIALSRELKRLGVTVPETKAAKVGGWKIEEVK